MSNLNDWTNRAIEYIHKYKATTEMAVFLIKDLKDFKNSGVSVDELTRSIAETLKKENKDEAGK